MVLLETKKKFLKLTKRPWVRNDYITNNASFCCWQRTTFLFVFRNEQRFKNLHGVIGNKERFSDKKFLNVMTYLQSEILIFLVFVSSSDLTLFSGDITKISGNMTKVSGDLTGYPSPLLL